MATIDAKPSDQIRYQRVRGLWRTGMLGRSSLFTGGDHLLVCDYRSGFTERYKRFYFSDIQAIIIRRTPHWLGGIAFWFFLGLSFLVIALSTRWNLFLEIAVGFCAVFALRHLIRGPSCRTHIQTAVQIDVLPMLKRVRKTNRILERLFPLIEQAQGPSVENATGAPAPASAIQSSRHPIAVGIAPAAVSEFAEAKPAAAAQKLSWIHVFTFGAVFLSGLNAIWEANYPSPISYTFLLALFGLSIVGGLIALVRQVKHRVHRGAFAMIWVMVISFFLGAGGVDYAFTMITVVERTRTQAPSQPPMINFLNPFQMRGMPGFNYVLWTYGAVAIFVGLLGLVFAFMPQPAKLNPPPLPEGSPA